MKLPLRKELFWDMEACALDEQKNSNIIIQRVLSFGTIEEFVAIRHYYDEKTIIQAIKQAGYFDPKTLSFVVSFFNIEKRDLLCYTKKQLNPLHWD